MGKGASKLGKHSYPDPGTFLGINLNTQRPLYCGDLVIYNSQLHIVVGPCMTGKVIGTIEVTESVLNHKFPPSSSNVVRNETLVLASLLDQRERISWSAYKKNLAKFVEAVRDLALTIDDIHYYIENDRLLRNKYENLRECGYPTTRILDIAYAQIILTHTDPLTESITS